MRHSRYQVAGYFTCPHCGADVPFDAPACPECGSDAETGWSQDAEYGDLSLYDDEPHAAPPASAPWAKYLIAALAALTLAAYLVVALPWGIYLVPLIALAIGIAYYATQIYPTTRRGVEGRLYRRLLQKARGDRALVERLVAYERQRNPTLDRTAHLLNAIRRWERDNR
jgi:hypothetical protein